MNHASISHWDKPGRHSRPLGMMVWAMGLCWAVAFLWLSLVQHVHGDSMPAEMEKSPEQAMAMVRETSQRLLASMEREGLNVENNQKRLYELVDEIVFDKFDFRRMSSRVLGKNWRMATAEQKEQFTEQFKVHLVFTYAMALKEYDSQKIEYLPLQKSHSSDRIKVQTRVLLAKGPIEIDYVLLHSQKKGWKVIDVLVAGVSLVITYRSSFQADIGRIGISGLITKLKENNDRVLLSNQS
uniref:Phospholipid transport system substrate-binding protein n=1 Tax=Candidatus Kentrum sp. MB TaxID=2138164 RepID=A0A450XNK9_9GAMM|nr:MAG: phospholipid transport system substrate-binding protein [Candidatus Kentron sp. MB]VFK30847.1 MAG: phospholipid transport system substrate-binding protein [Candidatus Kentron sp. MB]VFK75262.1 MAG: phospholipid transport system substrate-binding protein [Candidatus Kentron sp. MB]